MAWAFDVSEASKLSLAPINSDVTTTRIVTDEQARHWLSDSDTMWRLFPNRYIVCDIGIVVYRLQQANFDRILKRHLVVATEMQHPNGNATCHALSFGCGFTAHSGYMYQVYVYSDRPDDVTDLRRHLQIHLANAARTHTNTPIILRVLFGQKFPKEVVAKAVSVFQGNQGLRNDMLLIVGRMRFKNSKL